MAARRSRCPARQPYPDAAEALRELRHHGIAVGVVSNIGWDLRPVFRARPGRSGRRLRALLRTRHPEAGPRLFGVACALLGRDPSDVLMVGDDRHADAGAGALGCEVLFVDPLPVPERPDGLRVLRLPERATEGIRTHRA
ncbi:HAD family hydrolase [Streptomyces sp. ALB3]|uniref:HAD family hydrolase n=1 Tax=Streptomyces sp. ALB3 TaxID=3374278 RepID=UPI0037B75BBE